MVRTAGQAYEPAAPLLPMQRLAQRGWAEAGQRRVDVLGAQVQLSRAFGIVEDGKVVFKSDIGAAWGSAAQIQGVWLDPALRGRGLSEPAMAAVTEYVLADYPVACLYVNDFNTRAIRCYQRVGYEQVGEFATVLY